MPSFLGVAISLALLSLVVGQASNVSQSMDLYILQNQRQYDAKIKQLEDQLANFRILFNKRIEALTVQADSMQLKLEQASAQLDPITLIDSWSKQCVQNYSGTIPTVSAARTSITNCAENINGVLNSPESTYNTLNSYYKNNLKNGLAQCVKLHPTAQLNYTLCVTKVIGDANKYTVTSQNNFNNYLKSSECTAENRVRSSWQCSFGQVYSITSRVEVALQLIDTCIANRLVCGSITCSVDKPSCPNVANVTLAEINPQNDTIRNPFTFVTNSTNCVEFRLNR
ncbi:uncharacterized protein LOC119559444 [Drosophila subpulchrella]|uniref:uncharacterized protein LOC119559444 n=1 Tax=Drosophila subpulchrella TaxID=1486046 RepID=UPI0018A196F1|nr:uncharacterized protein LOC119559444 [Drosophila subpulchrella]